MVCSTLEAETNRAAFRRWPRRETACGGQGHWAEECWVLWPAQVEDGVAEDAACGEQIGRAVGGDRNGRLHGGLKECQGRRVRCDCYGKSVCGGRGGDDGRWTQLAAQHDVAVQATRIVPVSALALKSSDNAKGEQKKFSDSRAQLPIFHKFLSPHKRCCQNQALNHQCLEVILHIEMMRYCCSRMRNPCFRQLACKSNSFT